MKNIRSSLGRVARCSIRRRSIVDTISVANGSKFILEWPVTGEVALNWGDKLNPLVARMLSGRNPAPRQLVLNPKFEPVNYMIGSVLGFIREPSSVIYGTGFIKYDQEPLVNTMKICSVRGPLSEDKLFQYGIKPSGIYGDMALVLPEYFRPDVKREKGRIGIISHFREKNDLYWNRFKDGSYINIDISGEVCDVVKKVISCDYVISSSLHGLIVADAYKVPSVWVRPSSNPSGDFFKFHDYLKSVGRKVQDPAIFSDHVSFSEVEAKVELGKLPFSADELISACPFGTVPKRLWSEEEINNFYSDNFFPN